MVLRHVESMEIRWESRGMQYENKVGWRRHYEVENLEMRNEIIKNKVGWR
jgi:hypothetical protein